MLILLFIINLSIIFILWFGNVQSIAGQTDVGDVVAVVNYALRTSMAISMFTFITLGFSRAKASADRIDEVLEVEVDLFDDDHRSEEHTSELQSRGHLVFRHLL